jgi:hypothetical protein
LFTPVATGKFQANASATGARGLLEKLTFPGSEIEMHERLFDVACTTRDQKRPDNLSIIADMKRHIVAGKRRNCGASQKSHGRLQTRYARRVLLVLNLYISFSYTFFLET